MPTPADLRRVAAWHAKMSAEYAAKLTRYEHQGEPDTVAKCRSRAEGHGRYAEICEAAAKALSLREKRGAFVPPALREVLAFAAELGWPPENAKGWYDHFESNGWKVSGKAPMADWQAAARNGFRRWQREEGKAQRVLTLAAKDTDPPGWQEFLAAHPDEKAQCRHKEHRYAPERVQRAFLAWKR